MKTGFSKVLSVVLCLIMMAAMTSVAFAADSALTGAGTKTSPYVVSDEAGLTELAASPSAYDGKYIVLGADISITVRSWTPIGSESAPFKGNFDGKGYTIRNLKISNKANAGLFGYTANATLENVTLNSCTSAAGVRNEIAGGLVGNANNTKISSVKSVGGTRSAAAKAGGIVGKATGCTITDCSNGSKVSVANGANSGGIVGEAVNCDILRCINSGAISGGANKNCGGIAGSLTGGKISHCLNSGAVETTFMDLESGESSGTAGIAGFASGEVSYCGNAGTVTSGTDCSGIVAAVGQLTVSNCYNAGGLSGNTNYSAVSYPIAPASAGNAKCISDGDMTKKATFTGWDFTSVWYEPVSGDVDHGFPYPMLRDCNLHTLTVTEKNATCTQKGTKRVTCPCGLDETVDTAPALGHSYVVSKIKEANCTYEGEKIYKCSRCQEDNLKKETIPVDPEKHVDADEDNICDLCGKTIKEEEVKKSFFQRVIDFFKRIFDWIRNLFTRNKAD